ncbi:serine threonine- kinase isoform B [Chlorella sorokiniana]|uniref:Serine threonine-kinase isoform B n=1 Tax=Chlorella sorokiniana TaxID=3076 RepID=A0A2P6TWJ7_CHLSO|nr:serine threonine- kinase isoform B [Chlorella sorokiniana]|eukprot:PRW58424.1 serine threonine- kinase isoform B [Chlorella sorokiniana]
MSQALRILLQAAVPAAELAGGGGGGSASSGGGSTRVHLYSTASSSDVGTGEAQQTIPSTAAVVGAVVGGLSTLTICLAVALVFAVARIYGWRLFSAGGGKGGKRQSDVESVLQMEREAANGPIPSIVTTRLVESPTPTSRGSSSRAADAGQTDRTDNSLQMSPSGSSQIANFQSDVSWKDCLIDPEQIQILRRRDGRPWVLGGGAFGQVYKALYDGVQVVAAKVLTGLSDERMFNAFVREAAILRDMRDKNIVQFVGVCMGRSEEGQPDEAMMIQEFMEAGDMFKALKWRDHQGRRVYGYYARGRKAAIDIARGLHYLHAHKTVHLDMKSSNVLLTRDGTCKIADVGLARTLLTKNFLTHAGTMGTFAWSAPEVLTGQQVATSADIYSLGIVIWEIVTGEIPTRGTMRDPRVPEECPQSVLDLINRCCELDPAKRPTAKQVVLALEGGSTTPTSPETRSAPLRSASLAPWRDRLPQQVSKYMPHSGDSS